MSVRSTIFGTALLVLMLTAGAAQSLSGTNTVDSGDIIDRTIGTPDVKVGAFAGQTILDNSMTTNDINEATLRLTCPVGTTKLNDICYGPEKAATGQQPAMDLCRSKGMHLPSLSQAMNITNAAVGANQIWTDHSYQDTGGNPLFGVTVPTGGGSAYTFVSFSSNQPYRCVIGLGARLPAGVSASEDDDVDNDNEYSSTNPAGD